MLGIAEGDLDGVLAWEVESCPIYTSIRRAIDLQWIPGDHESVLCVEHLKRIDGFENEATLPRELPLPVFSAVNGPQDPERTGTAGPRHDAFQRPTYGWCRKGIRDDVGGQFDRLILGRLRRCP